MRPYLRSSAIRFLHALSTGYANIPADLNGKPMESYLLSAPVRVPLYHQNHF